MGTLQGEVVGPAAEITASYFPCIIWCPCHDIVFPPVKSGGFWRSLVFYGCQHCVCVCRGGGIVLILTSKDLDSGIGDSMRVLIKISRSLMNSQQCFGGLPFSAKCDLLSQSAAFRRKWTQPLWWMLYSAPYSVRGIGCWHNVKAVKWSVPSGISTSKSLTHKIIPFPSVPHSRKDLGSSCCEARFSEERPHMCTYPRYELTTHQNTDTTKAQLGEPWVLLG